MMHSERVGAYRLEVELDVGALLRLHDLVVRVLELAKHLHILDVQKAKVPKRLLGCDDAWCRLQQGGEIEEMVRQTLS